MKNEKPTAVYIHHAVMVDQIKWRVINISQSREPPLPNPNRVSEANSQNRLLARDHQESQAPRPLIFFYFASPLTHANRINSLSNALQPIQLDVSRRVNQGDNAGDNVSSLVNSHRMRCGEKIKCSDGRRTKDER